MKRLTEQVRYLRAANDDDAAGIVPGHLAARRMQRRIMTAVAILAVSVITTGIVQGYQRFQMLPETASTPFRV